MDTGAFVGQLLKLGIALAVVGGTVHLIGQYDERAAWFIVVILLLSIMVFQSSRTSAIDDFLSAVFGTVAGGTQNLSKSPPQPAPPNHAPFS